MPADHIDISAIITTFNRSAMLAAALKALIAQETGRVRYEVIVVDNNSTDDTRATIERFLAAGHSNLHYVFEPEQGISHGRNAGIGVARGDIIAFTDDDTVVANDWIATIARAFAEQPDVAYIGGKILPRWAHPPPPWLTIHHWWPLALLDQGDVRFHVNAANPLCLPTANAAFRREVFSRIGLFSARFSGREDHELYLRLWLAGIHGSYEPEMVVTASIQPERYLKSYHHRWNTVTGRLNSMMHLDEIMSSDGRLRVEDRGKPAVTLFGVPGSIYRQFLTESLGWLRDAIRRDESGRMRHENRLCYLAGYVGKRYEMVTAEENYSTRADFTAFIKAIFARVARKPG